MQFWYFVVCIEYEQITSVLKSWQNQVRYHSENTSSQQFDVWDACRFYPAKTVCPGDEVIVECNYTAKGSQHQNYVHFGEGTNEENVCRLLHVLSK